MPDYAMLNYPGSSGYGVLPGGRYGRLTRTVTPPTISQDDYPVIDSATGKVVSIKTGQPWTGKDPFTGKMYRGGSIAPDPAAIDPNDPAQRYKPIDIIKDPELAKASDDLMAQFKKTAGDAFKGFDDYLKEFKGQAGRAVASSRAASDTAGAESEMRAAQRQYAGDLGRSSDEYRQLNLGTAGRERGIVTQAQDILPQYDAAGQAIADRQMQELVKQVGRYKMGTGTPSSLGSDEQKMLLQGAADVLLPLKQAQIGRRYDILQNLALPVERDIAGRETSRISQFEPMIAGQQYQSREQVEGAIQSLKEAAANRDWTTAFQIMQVPALAAEIQQRIQAGDTSLLGAIGQLREQSRYRGLQDVLGANLSQPVGYSPGNLSFPAPSRYGPLMGGGGGDVNPLRAPNAPTTTGSFSEESGRYGRGSGRTVVSDGVEYVQDAQGQWHRTGRGAYSGMPAGSIYNPQTDTSDYLPG